MNTKRIVSLFLVLVLFLCAGTVWAESPWTGILKGEWEYSTGDYIDVKKTVRMYLVVLPDGKGYAFIGDGDTARSLDASYQKNESGEIVFSLSDGSRMEGIVTETGVLLSVGDQLARSLEWEYRGQSPSPVKASGADQFYGRWGFSRMETNYDPYLISRGMAEILGWDNFLNLETVIDRNGISITDDLYGYIIPYELTDGTLCAEGNTKYCELTDSGEIRLNMESGALYFTKTADAGFDEVYGSRKMFVDYTAKAPEGEDGNFPALMDQTLRIIRERLNAFGMKDVRLWWVGTDGIRVEIPETLMQEWSPDEALDLISAPGRLEFFDPQGNVFMTGDMVKSAEYQCVEGDHRVAFELTEEGTKIFADMTAQSIGMKITICLDGEVLIAPTVMSAITDGAGIINGLSSAERAREIAAQIMSGELPLILTQD